MFSLVRKLRVVGVGQPRIASGAGDGFINLTFVGLVCCGLVIGCVAPSDSSRNAIGTQTQSNRSNEIAETWLYSEPPDEMGRGKIRLASIRSSNTLSLDSPYGGEQHATLTLRKHPQHGNDVYISIERGQLLESDYNEKVRIRFDDGKLMSFGTVRPADHSSETLFLRGAFPTVLNRLKAGKTLRVEVPVYQNGNQVFVFNVAGFTWK